MGRRMRAKSAGFLNNVGAIALNSFREAMRDRILYVFVVFALIVTASSKVIGWVSVGEDIKVVRDLGLASLGFFGMLITVFVGANLIHKEMDRRTIYVVLARPVGRGEFLLGRYLGLLGVLVLVVTAMGVFFTLYQAVLVWMGAGGLVEAEGGAVPFGLVQAQFLVVCEFVLLTAIAVFFSTATTPVLSAVFTFLAYVLGHAAEWIYIFAEMMIDKQDAGLWDKLMSMVLKGLYYAVPSLDVFDLRLEAVHGGVMAGGRLLLVLVYGVSYAAAVLLAAFLVMRRKPL